MKMRTGVLVGACGLAFVFACGASLRTVVLNQLLPLQKVDLGKAPANLDIENWASRAGNPAIRRLAQWKYARVKYGDVTAGPQDEALVESRTPPGVIVFNTAGEHMATFQTEEDVEDFGAIRLPGRSHSDVLLYIYPTSNRSGTFRVMRLPEKSVLAEWVEKQAPSRFFIGPYETIESVAYFRNNVLVIRSGMGEILKEVLIPQSEFVGSLIGLARISSYLVVVGSGSASTQNHLVVVLDAKDQIVYEEIASGHAVKLATSGVDDRFEVWTETTKWQYRLPSTKQ